jgi:hypothetical protein
MDPGGMILEDLCIYNDRNSNSNFLSSKAHLSNSLPCGVHTSNTPSRFRASKLRCSKSHPFKASPSNYCSSSVRKVCSSKVRARISPDTTYPSVSAQASYMNGKVGGVDVLQVLGARANRSASTLRGVSREGWRRYPQREIIPIS